MASTTTGAAQATALAIPGIGTAQGTGTATAQVQGIIASDFVPATTSVSAEAQLNWASGVGATVVFGPAGNNSGQATITGSLALMNTASGSGSITIGNGSSPTTLRLTGDGSQGSIVVSANSTFDISNYHFLIDYGVNVDPVSTVRSLLVSGYNGGQWNGPGVISSAGQTLTNGLKYGVGWADGADGTGAVAGLSSGQIELKYTLLGDANLDGTVNGSDFSILAANFGLGVTNWDQGNFLYSSSVNGSDFSALAANFGQGDSGADANVSEADIAALDAFAIANNLPLPPIAAAPEPASCLLLSLGVSSLLARRRRRRSQNTFPYAPCSRF
jgi:hypothetical protein